MLTYVTRLTEGLWDEHTIDTLYVGEDKEKAFNYKGESFTVGALNVEVWVKGVKVANWVYMQDDVWGQSYNRKNELAESISNKREEIDREQEELDLLAEFDLS